jgi:hypothetical protein
MKKKQSKLIRDVIELIMIFTALGLCLYWYDWKLFIIIALHIGIHNYTLHDISIKKENQKQKQKMIKAIQFLQKEIEDLKEFTGKDQFR